MTPGINAFTILLPALLLLMAVVSQLGRAGVLARNSFVGIRIPSLKADDAAWRAGHRAAAVPSWIGFGVAMVAAAVSWTQTGSMAAANVCTAIVGVVFVATLVWAVIVAGRAARRS